MNTPLNPKSRRIRAVEITLTALVGGVDLYCLYAVIGQLIIWSQQPRFQNVVTGGKSVSAGFLLQTAVFAALFLLLSAALVFMAIRFFGKHKTVSQDPFPESENGADGRETADSTPNATKD